MHKYRINILFSQTNKHIIIKKQEERERILRNNKTVKQLNNIALLNKLSQSYGMSLCDNTVLPATQHK